jgi:hypothetical protein
MKVHLAHSVQAAGMTHPERTGKADRGSECVRSDSITSLILAGRVLREYLRSDAWRSNSGPSRRQMQQRTAPGRTSLRCAG